MATIGVGRRKKPKGRRGPPSEPPAAAELVPVAFSRVQLELIRHHLVVSALGSAMAGEAAAESLGWIALATVAKIEAALAGWRGGAPLSCDDELAALRGYLVRREAESESIAAAEKAALGTAPRRVIGLTASPCAVENAPWLTAVDRASAPVSSDGGKWLLQIACPWVDRVWARVQEDVAAGLLGPGAKVSTHCPSPLSQGRGRHVICVYTRSARDQEDILRVARQLATTAELKKMRISYKSNEQTLAGEYASTSAGGVALYTFGPPYEGLTKGRRKPAARRDVGPRGAS